MNANRPGDRPITPRQLRPDELGAGDPAETAAALSTAGIIASAIDEGPTHVLPGFADRVMAAIADEPAPAPAGFLTPMRSRGLLAGFAASIRLAWAAMQRPGRPPLGRAAALAYVLAIALAGTALAGVATLGVAGALGIVVPHQPQATPTALPSELSAPQSSVPPASESEGPETEPTEDATREPGATDDHGGGSGGAQPSEDSGGDNSGPGSTSGSDGGSGGSSEDGGGGASTPRPSATARPTETPKPTSTSSSGGGQGPDATSGSGSGTGSSGGGSAGS